MGTDEKKEQGDVVESICQNQILRKLLNERFNCSQCADFKSRGSRLITRCLQHLEQLRAELTNPPKRSDK